VVQLYLSPRDAKRPRAIKEMRGVERISLKAGEQRRVTFAITPSRDLRHYDVKTRAYAVDAGRYEVQVGASSADIRLRKELVVGE
jgi:beta-glucosidase